MSQIMRPGGHLLLGTSEANSCTSLVAHIDWLETCHMEMEMPSWFTKKSDRLITTYYNHTFTEWSNYRIFGFFGIIDRTSYTVKNYRTNTIIIVHRATLVQAREKPSQGDAVNVQSVLCLHQISPWFKMQLAHGSGKKKTKRQCQD